MNFNLHVILLLFNWVFILFGYVTFLVVVAVAVAAHTYTCTTADVFEVIVIGDLCAKIACTMAHAKMAHSLGKQSMGFGVHCLTIAILTASVYVWCGVWVYILTAFVHKWIADCLLCRDSRATWCQPFFFCRFIGSGTMCVCVCVSRQYVSSIYPRRLVCFFFICLNFQHDFHKSLDYRIASLSTGNKVRQWHCKLLVMTGQRHWNCVQRLSSQFCNIEMENSFNFIKWVCNVILSASE